MITSSMEEEEEESTSTSILVRRGLELGKKVAIAGAAITSAPVVIPPLLLLSTIGAAFAFPFGLYFATYACTNKLMSSLLLLPPHQLEEEEEEEVISCHDHEIEMWPPTIEERAVVVVVEEEEEVMKGEEQAIEPPDAWKEEEEEEMEQGKLEGITTMVVGKEEEVEEEEESTPMSSLLLPPRKRRRQQQQQQEDVVFIDNSTVAAAAAAELERARDERVAIGGGGGGDVQSRRVVEAEERRIGVADEIEMWPPAVDERVLLVEELAAAETLPPPVDERVHEEAEGLPDMALPTTTTTTTRVEEEEAAAEPDVEPRKEREEEGEGEGEEISTGGEEEEEPMDENGRTVETWQPMGETEEEVEKDGSTDQFKRATDQPTEEATTTTATILSQRSGGTGVISTLVSVECSTTVTGQPGPEQNSCERLFETEERTRETMTVGGGTSVAMAAPSTLASAAEEKSPDSLDTTDCFESGPVTAAVETAAVVHSDDEVVIEMWLPDTAVPSPTTRVEEEIEPDIVVPRKAREEEGKRRESLTGEVRGEEAMEEACVDDDGRGVETSQAMEETGGEAENIHGKVQQNIYVEYDSAIGQSALGQNGDGGRVDAVILTESAVVREESAMGEAGKEEEGGNAAAAASSVELTTIYNNSFVAVPFSDSTSSLSSEYASATEDRVSGATDMESGTIAVVVGMEAMVHSDNEGFDSEQMIWDQIDALRTIVGYKAPLQSTMGEELKALYLFTGVEPPVSLEDASDILEVGDKLRFLKAVVGVK